MKPIGKINTECGENGFTMIEVLIALTIFAIGMLAVAGMQIMGIQGNAVAKWQTQSASWGSDRIERLITLDYDDADLSAGSHGPVTEDQYEISWVVTNDDPMANTKTLVVSVAWTDRGKPKTTSFTYYRADL